MFKKLKAWLSDDSLFYAILILLIGIVSFGLGRLSMLEISTNTTQTGAVTLTQEEIVPEYYVASKNGSKYHLPWCPGATQMKEENKVVFKNKPAAEAAGYTPAGNCPGL